MRHPCQTTRTGAIFGKRVIRPQEAQHLCQVRLAAAEEPADPRGRLFGLALIPDVRFEDANEATLILTFTNKMLELETQGAAFVIGPGVGHRRDAVVQQGDLVGISLVDIPIFYTSYTPRSSCKVIGTAR